MLSQENHPLCSKSIYATDVNTYSLGNSDAVTKTGDIFKFSDIFQKLKHSETTTNKIQCVIENYTE